MGKKKSAGPLIVKPEPCQTCPYRKDLPSGVWAYEEYEKLRQYDEEGLVLPTFLCHQTHMAERDIACKGWIQVHRESLSVRLACATCSIDGNTCFEDTKTPLHISGNAAADVGQAMIDCPGKKALKVIEKLDKTGKFKS